jgi:hypothetical protein
VVRLRALPLENGSGESIHSSAGRPDAVGRPTMQAMPPWSAELSDGPRRPSQEYGAPVVREGRRYCFTLSGAYVRSTHHRPDARA